MTEREPKSLPDLLMSFPTEAELVGCYEDLRGLARGVLARAREAGTRNVGVLHVIEALRTLADLLLVEVVARRDGTDRAGAYFAESLEGQRELDAVLEDILGGDA